MPVFSPKKKAAPVVDASASATPGHKVISLEIPAIPMPTEAQIQQMETVQGKDILAVCDFTHEPITLHKNINVIQNEERPELNGKVMSTKFLLKMLQVTGHTVTLAKAKSEKKK